TDGKHLVIDWHGETIVDVDPATVAHDGPVYKREIRFPHWQDELNANTAADLPRPKNGDELARQLLMVVSSPNQADKSWVTDQYDRYVRGNSILAQPEDSGVIRIDEESGLGIALATDCNSRFAYLDPYRGAQLALAESYRNVAVTGAEPVAVTDCLNFGSPEDPEVMWQFSQAIDGLIEGCRILGTPVTGGNVSFYNRTGDTNILPTPLIGMLGVIDNVDDRVRSGFSEAGDVVLLLGKTRGDFDGSTWAGVIHSHLGGRPPKPDFEAEKNLAEVLVRAAKNHVIASAHDLSDGGLAQALVESALFGGLGVKVALPGDAFEALFSETPARAIVSLKANKVGIFQNLADFVGVPLTRLGEVKDDGQFTVVDQFSLPLAEIKERWQRTIPAVMGA
ncbi:MAG: phosphoribosylformylglycinamidine synthase II, partial [Propionibacteriaceae bacterium]|nr:phosphoribosylformylglycinamidine synthase II [Propionibacteriaceae bacterium]